MFCFIVFSFLLLLDASSAQFYVLGNETTTTPLLREDTTSYVEIFSFLPLIVVRILIIIAKIALTFLITLFTESPVDTLQQFASGFCKDVAGSLGKAIVDFVVAIFNAVV